MELSNGRVGEMPVAANATPAFLDRLARSPLARKLSRPGILLALYLPPLFLSALLMFWSQPLIGKMILPLLGGTPMVWTTCMVFFQAMLLAGYGYAHLSLRLGVRRQAALHIGLLILSLVALPIGFDESWSPPAVQNPMGWLFLLLAASVGAPFFMLSATAPMLQAWFARSEHKAAADPYFLYVTSNLGSFIGLIAFPTLAELYLTIPGQTATWSALYLVLVAIIVLAGVSALTGREQAGSAPAIEGPGTVAAGAVAAVPSWVTRTRWVLLAFAPSSLFIGLTTFVTTDVAAVPLLWIIPLAAYLLTFVVAFAQRPVIPHAWALVTQPFLVLPVVLMFFWGTHEATWTTITLHFIAFFATALVCHGELARTRPGPEYLTEFYLLLSLGGVLGGLFNAIAAPLLFTTLVEYPLILVLALLLRPAIPNGPSGGVPADLGIGVGLFALLMLGLQFFHSELADADATLQNVLSIVLALICFAGIRRPLRFGLAAAAILFSALILPVGEKSDIVYAERNFFGVVRVAKESNPAVMTMYHGTTNHGAQSQDPDQRLVPQTYYVPGSPLAQVFDFLIVRRPGAQLSVLGLGTGSIACFGRKGQTLTYYEIDPAVERVARNPELFTLLRDCPPEVKVVLGDGRLTLAKMPNGSQDLLVMDAFTSDAVPMHLLTKEAMAMYWTKLQPNGLLVYHISNRYLDLEPVLATLATDAKVEAFIQDYDGSQSNNPTASSSTWVIMARPGPTAEFIASDSRWRRLKSSADQRLWTDSYSNILSVMRW